jgi:hypothetical protein
VIRHYFHGSKKNRRYGERWQILLKYDYSPKLHVKLNQMGVLEPSKECPNGLLEEIMDYFKQRNEDECYQKLKFKSKDVSSDNLFTSIFNAIENAIGVNAQEN